jgi:hypothetical protein
MKQFALMLVAALLGVFGALWLYDRIVLQPRSEALGESLSRTLQTDLTRARGEAQQIASDLDAAVDRSVQGAQQAMIEQASEMERRRLAAEALTRASTFKVALAEHYMTTGKWPASAHDVGLGPPESYAFGAVTAIAIGRDGEVTVTVNDALAQGGRIRLIPKVDPQTYIVDWRCVTEGGDALRRYLPACE